MRKQIIFVLIIALVATSCEALNRRKKHNLRVLAEVTQDLTQSDNYSLQELLDFNVQESIDCASQESEYREIKARMQNFSLFLQDDPEGKLQDSIAALGQASLLLKKAKQVLDKTEEAISLAETNKSKLKIKKHNKDVLKHLNKADKIVNPVLFAELFQAIDFDGSLTPAQISEKLDHAINLIQILKSQFQSLLNESDSFGAYSQILNEKVNNIDYALLACQN